MRVRFGFLPKGVLHGKSRDRELETRLGLRLDIAPASLSSPTEVPGYWHSQIHGRQIGAMKSFWIAIYVRGACSLLQVRSGADCTWMAPALRQDRGIITPAYRRNNLRLTAGTLALVRLCRGYLHQERAQPERSCRRMYCAAWGQFFATILGPSHSIFWPARKDTQPSNMISVRRAATSKRE